MRLLFVALAAAALVACSPEPDYERMRASTVQVVVEIDGKPVGHGAGVIVEQGVLTAAHVARVMSAVDEDKRRVLVRFKDGEFVVAHTEKVAWKAGNRALATDIALLTIPTSSGYPVAPVNCDDANVGDAVYVVGHPGRVLWSVTEGKVISDMPRRGFSPHGRWLQMDATTSGGNSGGPIFNDRGEVVGIVSHGQTTGFSRAPTGQNFGQAGDVICDFLGIERVKSARAFR